ncbi:MAG TPA: hypothetical protein PLB01_04560 [Thermoanaerobaculia bacterium]|nr:hypothetical protein [Thermoanaerobaculia bacterium]
MSRSSAILVFSALLAFPALADDATPAPAATPAAAAKKKAAKKAAPQPAAGSANMIVTKDAETGELRPATPAEREKLLGRQPLAAPEHRVVTLPDGSQMVELTEADRSYAVATKNPDGTISRTCVHGAAEAAKAVASPAPATVAAPAPKTDR